MSWVWALVVANALVGVWFGARKGRPWVGLLCAVAGGPVGWLVVTVVVPSYEECAEKGWSPMRPNTWYPGVD